MRKKSNKPSVYDYIDHIQYLQDMFEHSKKEIKAFSYRYFSKKAGFSCPSTLKFFMDRKRNLSTDSIQKVAKGYGLDVLETRYFDNLVKMNQTPSGEKKNIYFQEMLKLQKRKKIRVLSSDHYDYFSKWYNPAVRELVRSKDFQGDPKWIAKRISPMISVIEARESIRLLERLGLIEKDKNRNYRQSDRALATEREILSMVARNFHREMCDRAKESLDNVPRERRDFSGVTFGLPSSKIQELKDRIGEFRKQLTSTLGSLEEETDEVYHMNIQLFPMTNKERK